METCIILSARRYDFQADNGQRYEGVTLTYITDDVQREGETRGCVPLSITAQLPIWDKLQQLPGFYEMDFRQRPGPKGKPAITVTDVKFSRPFLITPSTGDGVK